MQPPDALLCLAFTALLTAGLTPAARAQEAPLLHEGFEADLDRKPQLHGSNQPYEQHSLEISTDRAHGGAHSLKADFTYRHGLSVYLAPRTNDTPQVEWGSLGGAGTFNLPGVGLPLSPDKGYLLTVYLWVEAASPQNPVRIEVETASDFDYGVIRTQTYLDQVVSAPTQGWVKIEQELTSLLIDQMDAAGARTDGLRLSSISLDLFALGQSRMTVYADDLTVRELPFSAVAEARERQALSGPPAPEFRSHPAIEDLFIWGVYGGVAEPGPDWIKPLDPASDARAQQAQRAREYGDWTLLDLRRHYCNTLIQGAGMLLPAEGDSAYDYVRTCLDKCAEYGLKYSPSTYLTQHYATDVPREQCEAAMRRAAATFGGHPALLAYWLVDEPGASTAADFYWGKAYLEAQDPAHPALCACNAISSIQTFADKLPIMCLDYYPIAPVPRLDKGAWAVGDSVRYARTLGAHRIWVLPQVFGQSSWRVPSREEFLIQIFGGLAEGATGFLPFAHADRPAWHDPSNLYGHLVDPYGNPSPAWEEMRRLGPYLRSAGALLVGARRLPEAAATAQTSEVIVSPVGRKRPAVVARAFADERRGVRYLVVHNNAPLNRWSFPVAVAELAAEETVLDLFALREMPLTGNTFPVFLEPGDGRLYAVGQPESLAAVKREVYGNRYALERELLELEVKVADRMGTETGPVRECLRVAATAAGAGDFQGALTGLAAGTDLLARQSQANARFWPVQEALERTRASLGRANRVMARRLGGGVQDFGAADPGVQALKDRMVGLSARFYTLQAGLLRHGPDALAAPMRDLLSDTQAQEREAALLLGP